MPNGLIYQVLLTKQIFVHAWASTDCFYKMCEKQFAPNSMNREIQPGVWSGTLIQTNDPFA